MRGHWPAWWSPGLWSRIAPTGPGKRDFAAVVFGETLVFLKLVVERTVVVRAVVSELVVDSTGIELVVVIDLAVVDVVVEFVVTVAVVRIGSIRSVIRSGLVCAGRPRLGCATSSTVVVHTRAAIRSTKAPAATGRAGSAPDRDVPIGRWPDSSPARGSPLVWLPAGLRCSVAVASDGVTRG